MCQYTLYILIKRIFNVYDSRTGGIIVLQQVDSSVRSFLYCTFLILEYGNCMNINIGILKMMNYINKCLWTNLVVFLLNLKLFR